MSFEEDVNNAEYKKPNTGEPTIEDYKDIMLELQNGPIEGLNWVCIVWCDENGNSEFMDNFYKEMQKAAQNYGK